MLAFFGSCVQHHRGSVFVGLEGFDFVDVFVQRVGGAVDVLDQKELLGALKKLFVGDHAVFDDHLDVGPFGSKIFAVRFEHFLQLVCHFLGDVAADFLDVSVGLEVRTGHVQRNVLGVQNAVQQGQKVGYNALDVVRYKHLVLVQLDFVPLRLHVGLDAREKQDPGQVKRVVHVQVNVEQGFLKAIGIQRFVKLFVVFVGQFRGFFGPSGSIGVDDVGHFFGLVLGLFAFGGHIRLLVAFAKLDGDAHEPRVFLQELADLEIFQKIFAVVGHIEDDFRAAVFLLKGLQGEFGRAVAVPMSALVFGGLGVAFGLDFDCFGHHKGRIESQAKVPNHGGRVYLAFVLLHKFFRAGEGHLVDVLVHLFGGHANASVYNADLLLFLIDLHANGQVAQFAFELSQVGEVLDFIGGVNGVGNQFPQEDFVVAVEEFFDDGENVFRRNIDFSSRHNYAIRFDAFREARAVPSPRICQSGSPFCPLATTAKRVNCSSLYHLKRWVSWMRLECPGVLYAKESSTSWFCHTEKVACSTRGSSPIPTANSRPGRLRSMRAEAGTRLQNRQNWERSMEALVITATAPVKSGRGVQEKGACPFQVPCERMP